MNAVIRLRPEELTDSFFEQLKAFANGAKQIEIRLNNNDLSNNLSENEIEERLHLLSDKKTVSFSMKEFEAYVHKIAV